jgi:uncharacterized membrane protein YfhO
VFSEIYYPEGWTATIDGKPADIVRVNYLLRGLEVAKGKHKIVFQFDLPKYQRFNTFSMIACLAILLLIAGACWYELRKKREQKTAERS